MKNKFCRCMSGRSCRMDRSADPSDPVLYLCDEKVEQGKKGNCCLSGYNTENEKNKFRLAIMEDTVIMIL